MKLERHDERQLELDVPAKTAARKARSSSTPAKKVAKKKPAKKAKNKSAAKKPAAKKAKTKVKTGDAHTVVALLAVPAELPNPSALVAGSRPIYSTSLGSAYSADSAKLLAAMPDSSVNLVVTSPPYALHFKKEYGNVEKSDYIAWMLPFARQIHRTLKDDGSFVLNIGGSYNSGQPTRSLYHFKLLIALCEEVGFHLAQECFWYNPAKLPVPAEWVNVRRMRIKDSIEYVWWLSKSPWPKANNREVLTPYSDDMQRLLVKGYKAKKRPSGHNITNKFQADHGGSIPANLLIRGNNESNSAYVKACNALGQKVHPARFPSALPEFYIRMLTEPGDLVVDPFAGSNTTGRVAENLYRRWLSVDLERAYVQASAVRFDLDPLMVGADDTQRRLRSSR